MARNLYTFETTNGDYPIVQVYAYTEYDAYEQLASLYYLTREEIKGYVIDRTGEPDVKPFAF